jgi:hypothetical protein
MKRMATRTVAALVVLAALLLTGCTSVQRPAPTPEAAPGGPSTGTMVAPGLNDLADGTSEAIGTLKWIDLEGGFWAIMGGTEATGDVGRTVAVLANAAKGDPAYVALTGKMVRVVGTRAKGASVRAAGPEIVASSISQISEAGAPNQ